MALLPVRLQGSHLVEELDVDNWFSWVQLSCLQDMVMVVTMLLMRDELAIIVLERHKVLLRCQCMNCAQALVAVLGLNQCKPSLPVAGRQPVCFF
jgi:hypothetical protein